MKKRLFLIICAMMCLFLVLCSCACDDENADNSEGGTENSAQGSGSPDSSPDSGDSSTGSSDSDDRDHSHQTPIVNAPETDCTLNEKGHYWYDVSINKNTDVSGSVILTGKCYLCGDFLSREAVALVDYEEWKAALSAEGLSSFTLVSGGEYTDFDENGSVSWRIKNGTYSADYFINLQEKNSSAYAKNFQGFSLKFNDFKYDSQSKTYVYWINESSYVELGFADGKLIYHATVSKVGDEEKKSATLYLNHQRVEVGVPTELTEKYEALVTKEALAESKLSSSDVSSICEALSSLSFDLSYELSLLENDGLSVYFYLNSPAIDPIAGTEYTTASVVAKDGKVTSISFGSTTVEVSY